MSEQKKIPCEFCGFMHNFSNAWSPEHIAYCHNKIQRLEYDNARLRSELATQETLVATLQEQKYEWDELLSENRGLRKAIEEAEPPECKYPNLCKAWDTKHEPDCKVLAFYEWKRNALES